MLGEQRKFKIGDRVRCCRRGCLSGDWNAAPTIVECFGYVFSCLTRDRGRRYCVQVDGSLRFWFREDEMQKTVSQEIVDAFEAAAQSRRQARYNLSRSAP